ncbi:transcription factor bHLH19 isoform X2 [Beta vulgaris subsp. vulgaris]|nr:transcription factor bHLH19 isoform X2 [Beta vulgaris subsp. vulgaris]
MESYQSQGLATSGKGVDEADTATSDPSDSKLKNSLPEIEVKILGKTILLNVYCENKRGILATLVEEVEKHDMKVLNCSMIPFESFALDITIVAQMEKDFNQNVKDLVQSLRSVLVVANPGS